MNQTPFGDGTSVTYIPGREAVRNPFHLASDILICVFIQTTRRLVSTTI